MQIKKKSELEFIIVMASLMSLVALSIDALLPAISDISKTIHIVNPKNNQLFITMIFLGLGFGQLISGQLDIDRSDYLKRDSFYTGVSEGNINSERLISMMNVVDDKLVIEEIRCTA